MPNIQKLAEDALKLFPSTIDISDGELRGDNGFYSASLSNAWDEAEKKNGVSGNDMDFMIWSVFKLLHIKSRDFFAKGIYNVSLEDIEMYDLKAEFNKVMKKAK